MRKKQVSFADIIRTYNAEEQSKDSIDLFPHYIIRPISYPITWLFLHFNISANAITFSSLIFVIIGCILIAIGSSTIQFLGGLFCLIWLILDCVDGNIARYYKSASPFGAFIDSIGGYFINAFLFFSGGIAAYYSNSHHFNVFNFHPELLIIIGAFSSIVSVLSRLVYQKYLNQLGSESISLTPKSRKTISLIIAQNVASVSGFMQPALLLCIYFRWFDFFTLAYGLINTLMFLYSMLNTTSAKNSPDIAN